MSQPLQDRCLVFLIRFCGTVAAGVAILIAIFVALESFPSIRENGLVCFFTDESWQPKEGQYNLTPMLVGTLAATMGSLLLTAPLGIGCALFLRFYSPKWSEPIARRSLEVLAGVPSVVYGLWGLAVLVPAIANISPLGQGQSLLAGIIILTMMTLPTVALSADSALAAVPADQIRAAAALGLGRRATAWTLAIPLARRGIASGIVLQFGRAIGETMAVLMICGNVVAYPESPFSPVITLTSNIALEMGYADAAHRSALFVSGLILLTLVIMTMLFASVLSTNESTSNRSMES